MTKAEKALIETHRERVARDKKAEAERQERLTCSLAYLMVVDRGAHPMTPPLCPTCGRRASERFHWELDTVIAPGWDKPCPSPFHDAGDWGPALLECAFRLRSSDDGIVSAAMLQLAQIHAAIEGRKEDGDV